MDRLAYVGLAIATAILLGFLAAVAFGNAAASDLPAPTAAVLTASLATYGLQKSTRKNEQDNG
jgi:hypothetical protein